MRWMPRARTLWWIAVAAIVAVSVFVVIASESWQAASYGWFAYQPLTGDMFTVTGGVVFVSPIVAALLLLVTVGLLVAGYLVGHRTTVPARSIVARHPRLIRYAAIAAAALALIGAVIVYGGLTVPQPSFSYEPTTGPISDPQTVLSDPSLLLTGIYTTPAALGGVGLTAAGLAIVAYLVGVARRGARVLASRHAAA